MFVKKIVNLKVLVDQAKESEKFSADLMKQRAKYVDDAKDLPPVFNKRLFASQGSVILTNEARRIMKRNEDYLNCEAAPPLSSYEFLVMRSVVNGLKLVHKDKDFVKDILSQVVTLEFYKAFSLVRKKDFEDRLSCFYIVHGAVEVTYDMSITDSKNVFQPNIIYSHGTGEYIGLVSSDGKREDLAPPATLFTKEDTELLRIDRQKFHQLIEITNERLTAEKMAYLANQESVLSFIEDEVKEKISEKLLRQESPPNKLVLEQRRKSDWMYFILDGHCHCFREVYITEADRYAKFFLANIEKGDFFGEECILDKVPSSCTVVTNATTVFYKLHKSALDIVPRDQLANILNKHRNKLPGDKELQEKGYSASLWSRYKYSEVRHSLLEKNKLHCLINQDGFVVRPKTSSCQERHRNDLQSFIIEGGSYRQSKAKSASVQRTTTQSQQLSRAMTTLGVPATNTRSGKNARRHVLISTLNREDSSDSVGILNGPKKSDTLASMKAEEIVKKAKALVDKYAQEERGEELEPNEELNTTLQSENTTSRILLVANKYRAAILRRKMIHLQGRREKIRLQYAQKRDGKVTAAV